MAYQIGTVDNSAGLAHYAMLEAIKLFAESLPADQAWQVLRYETVADNRELILKGPGLSGDDEIYIGFRTYQSVSADYYNLLVGVFTGYVPGNTFDQQPGAALCGVPAHNQRIDYWMVGNGQRIAFGLKVGTPVYTHGYAGKFLPYAAPGEYRAPLVCAGMLDGAEPTRFSDALMSFPYRGTRANMRMRSNMGSWLQPDCWPFVNTFLCGNVNGTQVRPTGQYYYPQRIELSDAANLFGTLDGIFYIPGFDNSTENVLQIGGDFVVAHAGKTLAEIVAEIRGPANGRAFVVLQDVGRTGFSDYIAMEMT